MNEFRIALLRAVNVGGTGKLPMADLRTSITKLGFTDVQTLLQSGNLIFRSGDTPTAELETFLEQSLLEHFQLSTEILIRTPTEWRDMINQNPFKSEAADNPSRTLAMPLKTVPNSAAIEKLKSDIPGGELVESFNRHLFLYYPDGMGQSKLTNVFIERRLGTKGTARNWNTVLKIAALLNR